MIRKLMESIREYKKPTILAPIFITLEVVMEVIIPLFMAKLIDEGIDGGDYHALITVGCTLIVFVLMSLLFGILAGKYAAVASSGFAKNLRHDMFHKVQSYSFRNIDKFSTSGIVTRMTTDVQNLQNSYQMIVRIALRTPTMLIFSLTMALTINAKLAVIFLCIMPVLAIGIILIMTKVHPIFKRVFKTYDKLNGVVQENLHGIRVVKSFVREEHEKKKFADISGQIYNDFVKAEKRMTLTNPLMQTCMYASILLISWFGARMIVTSGGTELSTGELMSMMTYAMQILGSLMMLSMVFVMIVMSRASAERVVEILNEDSDVTSPANAVTTVKDGSVSFENVCFSYSGKVDKCCLKNITINIPAGSTVGILGGTGSGKSSMVQLIPRLYDVTSGSVKVGGLDVREYDLDVLREEVAMVLQKNVLFSGTIKDNLRWGNENATDEEIIHACRLACAHDFITAFPNAYDTYIEQGGKNVSGGQKQRLCIARALLKKPKILILDDSTSAVDTHTDAMIRKAFLEEIPDTTKFIIAQRISSIEDTDFTIVLDNGVVTGIGTHAELIENNEIYREVYEAQQKGSVPQ